MSLTSCLSKAKRLNAGEAKALRVRVRELKKSGRSAEEAERLSVDERITELVDERGSIETQVRGPGPVQIPALGPGDMHAWSVQREAIKGTSVVRVTAADNVNPTVLQFVPFLVEADPDLTTQFLRVAGAAQITDFDEQGEMAAAIQDLGEAGVPLPWLATISVYAKISEDHLVQLGGEDITTTAFYSPFTGVLAINPTILSDIANSRGNPADLQRSRLALRDVIAHELGHMVDFGYPYTNENDQFEPLLIENASTTTKSEAFKVDIDAIARALRQGRQSVLSFGEIMGEAFVAFAEDREGLEQFLSYPMNSLGGLFEHLQLAIDLELRGLHLDADQQTLERIGAAEVSRANLLTNKDVADYHRQMAANDAWFLQIETFAQLMSLYFNYPQVMLKAMPKAFALMKEISDGSLQTPGESIDDRHTRLRQTLRVQPPVASNASHARGSNDRASQFRREFGVSTTGITSFIARRTEDENNRPKPDLRKETLEQLAKQIPPDERVQSDNNGIGKKRSPADADRYVDSKILNDQMQAGEMTSGTWWSRVWFRTLNDKRSKAARESIARIKKESKGRVEMRPMDFSEWQQALKLTNRARWWYEVSSEKFREHLPDLSDQELKMFIAFVSGTSAQVNPFGNIRRAVAAYSQFLRGEPIETDLMIPGPLINAIREGALPGLKEGSFAGTMHFVEGLEDTAPLSTNDSQVASMFGLTGADFRRESNLYGLVNRFFLEFAQYQNDLLTAEFGEGNFEPFEAWQIQAAAWVSHRDGKQTKTADEVGDTPNPDDFWQALLEVSDKKKRKGVVQILQEAGILKGNKLTREVLMDPRTPSALSGTLDGFRESFISTMEINSQVAEVEAKAMETFGLAKELDDKKGLAEFFDMTIQALQGAARRRTLPLYVDADGHPTVNQFSFRVVNGKRTRVENDRKLTKKSKPDSVSFPSVIQDIVDAVHAGPKSPVRRIATGTTERPFDVGGTWEGVVSPNIRIPLQGLTVAERKVVMSVLGLEWRQFASATSRVTPLEPDSVLRQGTEKSVSVFVKTTDDLGATPDIFAKFSKAAKHEVMFKRVPNGYQLDLIPNKTGENITVVPDEQTVLAAAQKVFGNKQPFKVYPTQFESDLLFGNGPSRIGGEFGATISNWKRGVRNQAVANIATILGVNRSQARAFLNGKDEAIAGVRNRQKLGRAKGIRTRAQRRLDNFNRASRRARKVASDLEAQQRAYVADTGARLARRKAQRERAERAFAERKRQTNSERNQAAGLQLRGDGRVEVIHWGRLPELPGLDPQFHGTGINGAERRRKLNDPQTYQDRTYFGMRGYRKEADLGPHKYTASFHPGDLYDWVSDPDGFGKKAANAANITDLTLMEKMVVDAGYVGYYNSTTKGMAIFETTIPETYQRDDGAPVVYSRQAPGGRPTGQTIKTVIAALRKGLGARLVKRLLEREDFQIVQSDQHLPAHLQHNLGGVKGVFDPETGITYLVADNIFEDGAVGVVLHEVGVHFGLRSVLGNRYDQIIAAFKRLEAREHPAATEARRAVPRDTLARHRDEEALAYFVEQRGGEKLPLWRQIMAAIRAFLGRLGLTQAINDDALVELALFAVRAKSRGATSQRRTSDEGPLFSNIELDPVVEEALKDIRYSKKAKLSLRSLLTVHQTAKAFLEKHRGRMWTQFRQGLVDQFASFKDILHDPRSYMQAHLATSNAAGGLEAIMLFGEPLMKQGALTVEGVNEGVVSILEPLRDEVNLWFAWMAGNRAKRLQDVADEGSDVDLSEIAAEDTDGLVTPWTREQIQGLIDMASGETAWGADRAALWSEVQTKFDKMNAAVVQIGVKTGVINREEADRWLEEGFYIPFQRVIEDMNQQEAPVLGGARGQRGGLRMMDRIVRQTAIRRFRGSERPFDDLVENTLANWQHVMGAGLKNSAALRALLVARKMGLARQIPAGAPKPKNTVWVRRNGKREWWVLADNQDGNIVFESLVGMNWQGLNGPAMKTLRAFKRALTLGVTVSPDFKTRNLIRDTIIALAVTGMSKNPVRNLIQGWKATRLTNASNIAAIASGATFGFSGFLHGADPDAVRFMVERGAQRISILDTPALITRMWKAYQAFGVRLENVNRLANFEQDLAAGRTHLEAAFNSRDHLDFQRTGTWPAIKFLSQTVPFLNARLQGLDKLGRAAMTEGQRKQFIAVAGWYGLMSVAVYLLMKDDDDYKNAEQWERDSYHLFKLPGIDDVMFRLPRPFELGAMATTLERMVEYVVDDDAHAELFFERIRHAIFETFAFNPTPQAFMPFIEVVSNRNFFTGRPIESVAMDRLEKEDRRRVWTTETSVLLSRLYNTIAWDKVSLSPVQIDHLVEGYFGWAGATVLGSVDMLVTRPVVGAPPRPAWRLDDFPLVRSLVRQNPSRHSRYVTEFYDALKDIEKTFYSIKQARDMGDLQRAADKALEGRNKLAMRKVFNDTARRLSFMNKQRRRVATDKTMSSSDKATMLQYYDNIKRQMTQNIMENLGKRLRE